MKAICNLDVHMESKAPKPSSQTKEVPQEKDTQSSSAKAKIAIHPSPPTPMVSEMHKEAQQAAGGPTSLEATSEEGSHPQLNSGANEESRADDISLKVKLENLSDILKDTRSAFFTPDSPPNEPIINSDESEEEDEVAKDKDTEATSHDVPKDTLVPPPPSLKSAQIQELMAQNIQWELPAEFLNLPSQVSSVQEKLKTLDSLPSLLHKVTDTLNRFATMVENASGATSMNVPSAGKATASPAEGEKNTKDADTNLKDELVDLLGKNVVTQYYTKKLLFDKYCDKMLKRKKSPKITNCEVLTKKGPITLKIYREDGSDEVISNLKVSDLHSAEWREVIQACPDKSEKGWKTIYDLVKTRLDQLTQTEQELKIDLNKSLKEQDPLNELNELANKKRKRTSDLKDHFRSTKKHKSSTSALQVLRTLGSIFTPVYAAVQKLKKDSWKELQFSLVDNSKLNVIYPTLIINGKVTVVDDEGKPLENVDSSGDHDSEDEVESVDNEMASFLASKKVGYSTNSLLEQWKETYENADYNYNPYDEDMYEGQEIPDKI
ncbi:hypothetical protein Tco_0770573 [Tanacetum coccineum]|uniref:Uncharacterized protein n=1 Tax=Tanacetum coccineum TaxID=301880 RepID=A0ABQ4ZFJ4_9ASTR